MVYSSSMEKLWEVKPTVTSEQLAAFPTLDPVTVQLLVNRGIESSSEAERFLHPEYDTLHDPFLFRDMQKAVDRIISALKEKQSIVLYGDYDVDGVSSLAILFATFRALNVHDNVQIYIPDRYTEGYGMNETAVRSFHQQNVNLIIACDCGSSNVKEIAAANELGMDVIVVDHHKQPPEVPAAYAMLNPVFLEESYPFKKLCSGGVAYKLATALLRSLSYGKDMLDKPLPEGWEKWLLDFVALSTIADMMQLVGENRTLVTYGLKVLRKSRRLGLQQLARAAGATLAQATTGTVGFHFAPRLNAAGRLKHANSAFQLLITEDAQEARQLADELHSTNKDRQELTMKILDEAVQQIPTDDLPVLLVAKGEGWSSGVVGLVAGRLKEKFHRPALAISMTEDKVVGSGRSISGLDITQALVESREHLAHFGGHPMACGFTVLSPKALEPFITSMQTIAERELQTEHLVPKLIIDAEIPLQTVTWDLQMSLEQLEPYGMGNPEPVLCSRNVAVQEVRTVGSDKQHLRLVLADEKGGTHQAIGFRLGSKIDELKQGSVIDCIFRLTINEWNGRRDLQVEIIAIRETARSIALSESSGTSQTSVVRYD